MSTGLIGDVGGYFTVRHVASRRVRTKIAEPHIVTMSRRCFVHALAVALLTARMSRSGASATAERGRGPAGPGVNPARDARHDARRRDRSGGGRRRDAGVQRACGARAALPPGLRHGAGNAAVAQLDDDRASIRRATACTRTRGSFRRRSAARRAAAAGRLSNRGIRVVVRAGAAVRPRARVRRLRRQFRRRPNRPMLSRRLCPSGVAADDGRGLAELARPDASAALPLGALQRSARALRAAGAVPQPLRASVRISARWRRWTSSSAGSSEAFDRLPTVRRAIIVVADHGEGLGDHGEPQHGNLLYQSTMHVPLVMVGPGVAPGTSDAPVSTRRVFHTILDWAGLGSDHSLALRGPLNSGDGGRARRGDEAVSRVRLAAAGDGGDRDASRRSRRGRSRPTISRRTPDETRKLGAGAQLAGRLRKALEDYPGAVAVGGAGAREPRRGRQAAAGEPGLHRRERGAGRPEGRAAAGRHDGAARADRAGVSVCSRPASTRRRSRCWSRFWRRIRTTSTRRCGWRRRTRCSATTPSGGACSNGRPRSRRSRRTCASISACTTRERRTGSAPCRCWRRPPRRCRIALPCSKRSPTSRGAGATCRAALALRQRINELRTPPPRICVALGELGMEAGRRQVAIAAFEARASAAGGRFHARSRAGRPVSVGAALRRGEDRARSRAVVQPRLRRWRCSSARRSACSCASRTRRANRGGKKKADADHASAHRDERSCSVYRVPVSSPRIFTGTGTGNWLLAQNSSLTVSSSRRGS